MDIKAAASAYNAIAGIAQNAPTPGSVASGQGVGPSFADLITQSLSGSVDSGYKAEKVSSQALIGKADLTDLVTAVNSAELALNTVVTIRDKMISAYQSILQMPM